MEQRIRIIYLASTAVVVAFAFLACGSPLEDCNKSDNLFLKGLTQHESGEFKQAIATYEKAVKLCSDNCLAKHSLAEVKLDSGDFAGAIEAGERALHCYEKAEEENEMAETWLTIGMAKGRRGDTNGALNAFKKASELDSLNIEAFARLGLVYVEKQDFVSAIDVLQKAVNMNQDYAFGWYGLAIAAYQMGKREAALFAAKRTHDLEPRVPDYWEVYQKIKTKKQL